MSDAHPGSGVGRGIAGAAVVTGAASGIGAAVARQLAARGVRVGVLDRDAAGAERVAAEVDGLALHCDVGDSSALTAALEWADDELGGLGHLVNNAGVGNLKAFETYTDREVDLIWKVNVAGTFSGLRAAAPILRRRGGGTIVNVASVSGVRPTRGEAPYSAAKAAVIALTRSAALEFAPTIRVNCVSPGFVRTPLNEVIAGDEGMRTRIESATPLGRVGDPDEVADAVTFLLSERSSYLTGHNLVLDGGSLLDSAQMDPTLRQLMGAPPD